MSEGGDYYVWPAAGAAETWADVPDGDREALAPLHGDADLRLFEEADAHLGYRILIHESGHRVSFVAGD
jgi:hypothetical protein